MFGYVTVNQNELKLREFDHYRSYYCGVCCDLRDAYGKRGQLTLSYDTTFLALLLTSLYEEKDAEGMTRCVAHPLSKHKTRRNAFTRYAADVGVILSFYSCMDDWTDEKRYSRLLFAKLLSGKEKAAENLFKEKAEVIAQRLAQLREAEEKGENDLDLVSGYFGELMGEIFVCRKDEWESALRRMGFYLGKYIYILDAYDDLEKDKKTGSYNPVLADPLSASPDDPAFVEKYRGILTQMMAECCRSFESLPILENADILRNILYSGVWARFEDITKKRQEKTKQRIQMNGAD